MLQIQTSRLAGAAVTLAVIGTLGCDLGIYQDPGSSGTGTADAAIVAIGDAASPGAPDAAPAGSADARPPAPGDPDAAPVPVDCDEPVSSYGDGYHYRGKACLSCHDVSVGGLPPFTLAGTLYNDAAGTTYVAGATIRAVDDDGNTVNMVTTDNGNFWATQSVSFPVTLRVSMCPDTVYMPNPISSSGADCNAGGCHSSGARIHLP